MYVHLAPAAAVRRIRRAGIARARRPYGDFPGGVFAVPVTADYVVTHQWVRELARWCAGPMVGVYFRIPDDERVWAGHYHKRHHWMTAAQACATFMATRSRLGWEVIIPRKIGPGEIRRVGGLRQTIGWRYFPGAHGRAPCPCASCTRGAYKAASIRRRLGDGE